MWPQRGPQIEAKQLLRDINICQMSTKHLQRDTEYKQMNPFLFISLNSDLSAA